MYTRDRLFRSIVITIRSFPHSCLITGFVAKVTRQVPLAFTSVFSGLRYWIFKLICIVLQIVVCLFFLFAIGFDVLRVTSSGCSFGIFKLFLKSCMFDVILDIVLQLPLGLNKHSTLVIRQRSK